MGPNKDKKSTKWSLAALSGNVFDVDVIGGSHFKRKYRTFGPWWANFFNF